MRNSNHTDTMPAVALKTRAIRNTGAGEALIVWRKCHSPRNHSSQSPILKKTTTPVATAYMNRVGQSKKCGLKSRAKNSVAMLATASSSGRQMRAGRQKSIAQNRVRPAMTRIATSDVRPVTRQILTAWCLSAFCLLPTAFCL